MKIGKIIGTVTATQKDNSLIGCKLMILQPTDVKGITEKEIIVAVDTVGAGIGEIVLYVTGTVSRSAVKKPDGAIDAAIVGIIDNIDVI